MPKKLVMGSIDFLKSLKCNIGKNLVMTIGKVGELEELAY